MITTIVRFPLPADTTLEAARVAFEASAPNYENVPGLIRKYYLFGDGPIGGGIYLWQSRQAADAAFTQQWKAMVADKYGATPNIEYFETPVTVEGRAPR